MARRKDTQAGQSGEYLKMIWDNPDLHDADTAPLPTRAGLFDHTEPYGSRLPNPVGTPGPDTTGPDSPTPAAAPEPKKVFNPWKFGRTTLPPGLRRELMLAELPDSPEYVAPEGEGAAAQLEPVATQQVTTDVKSDAVPPTTVRTQRARSRAQRRSRLWFLAPILGLCFLGGGAVSVLTKQPSASSSADDNQRLRRPAGQPVLPARPTATELGSARAEPLPANASEKTSVAPATEEAVRAPRQSATPREQATRTDSVGVPPRAEMMTTAVGVNAPSNAIPAQEVSPKSDATLSVSDPPANQWTAAASSATLQPRPVSTQRSTSLMNAKSRSERLFPPIE